MPKTVLAEFSSEGIQRAYDAHFAEVDPASRPGWAFIGCDEAKLCTASVGIIGLNPGGEIVPGQASWHSPEYELAYLDEPWGPNGMLNPLQMQIKSMLNILNLSPEDVFAAQLVPFRSRSWMKLHNRDTALSTFLPFWSHILKHGSPRLWISLGKAAGRHLAQLDGPGTRAEVMTVGWGRQNAELFQISGGRSVLALPHLSRFRLFEPPRQSAVAALRAAALRAGTPSLALSQQHDHW